MVKSDTVKPGVEPKTPDVLAEVGIGVDLPFSSWVDGSIEILRQQGDEFGPTIQQLVSMRRQDGQARALYRLLTLPIRSALARSDFLPVDGGQEEADFIEDMFRLPPAAGGMEVSFNKVMSQILLALFDGFSPFEFVYQQPKDGPLAGKFTLKKLAYRPSDTITFLVDDRGNFQGFKQRCSTLGKTYDVNIPADRAFYFAAQEEEREFFGVSYFQSAFYHYDKKVKLYYIYHLAAQRAAVGTRVGSPPLGAGARDITAFKSALAQLGVAQWMMLPNDQYKVDSMKEGGTFDFLGVINHHNSQMSKSVLAGFFDSNQGGGASDKMLVNFGQESDTLFLLMLQSIMDEIAEAINTKIIPRFIDWNFNSGKYPRFNWGSFTDEQKRAVSDIFKTLATSTTTPVTRDFIFDLERKMARELDLELDYDELHKEFVEDKAKQKEAADAARQRMIDGDQIPSSPQQGGVKPDTSNRTASAEKVEMKAQEDKTGQKVKASNESPDDVLADILCCIQDVYHKDQLAVDLTRFLADSCDNDVRGPVRVDRTFDGDVVVLSGYDPTSPDYSKLVAVQENTLSGLLESFGQTVSYRLADSGVRGVKVV